MEEKRDGIGTGAESVETKPEGAKHEPENIEVKPESTKQEPENIEARPADAEGMEPEPEEIEVKPEGAEQKQETESAEIKPEIAKQPPEPESTEAKPENEKQKPGPENIEARPDDVEDKADKGKAKKGRLSRKKVAGFMQLAAAFILLILSVRLFLNTRGTRLLYVSVTVGRVSRFYWIFLAAAFILLLTGALTLRRSPKKLPEPQGETKENLP